MNRRHLAFANFGTNYKFNPTFGPVILGVRHLRTPIHCRAKSTENTMGIQYTYRRLPENELVALEADPERAISYLFSIPGMDLAEMAALLNDPQVTHANETELLSTIANAQSDPTRVDLDKDWHALHFLLTNDASMNPDHRPNAPLHNVVMGGQPTTIDATFGPVRKFSTHDIRQIVDALRVLTVEDLRARFSAESFNAARIYPARGNWDTEEVESVFQLFPKLLQLFEDALTENEIVIVYAA